MKTKKALAALCALAQESRLAVYRLLVDEGEDGLSAGMIAERLGIPPTTMSFHLSQLKNAGMVEGRKDGKLVIYTANTAKAKKLAKFLTSKNDDKTDEEKYLTGTDD